MTRERALKVVLVIVGILFVATIYPLVKMREAPTLQMMLSVYVTLGVFLLIASRKPAAHRSLIAFGAWSSIAHAATMAVQSIGQTAERMHLQLGAVVFFVIGIALIALAPRKTSGTAG